MLTRPLVQEKTGTTVLRSQGRPDRSSATPPQSSTTGRPLTRTETAVPSSAKRSTFSRMTSATPPKPSNAQPPISTVPTPVPERFPTRRTATGYESLRRAATSFRRAGAPARLTTAG